MLMGQEDFDVYLRRRRVMAGGLIVISLIILQDFISLGSLDSPAFVSVVAFSIAFPALAGTLVLYQLDFDKTRYLASKWNIPLELIFFIGLISGYVGVAAAFWHVSQIAGTVFLITTSVVIIVYGSYLYSLRAILEQTVLMLPRGSAERTTLELFLMLYNRGKPKASQDVQEPIPTPTTDKKENGAAD